MISFQLFLWGPTITNVCASSILSHPQVLQSMGVDGVLVLEVPHGSPAALAGLRPTHRDIFGDIVLGDVLVGMEGRPVSVRGACRLLAGGDVHSRFHPHLPLSLRKP